MSKEMMVLKGRITREVHRKDGRVEKESWDNTIQAGLKEGVIDAMTASATNIAMDNLFTALMNGKQYGESPNPAGYDGIMVKDEMADWYAIDMSSSGLGVTQPSSTTFQAKGTFTASADVTLILAQLGVNLSSADNFGTPYAQASSWSTLSLSSGDYVTITWQITQS
jgi:hypothetical protein